MQVLLKPTRFLLFLFLLFGGLYFTRSILVPLTIGGLLAMLFFPVSLWLETKGIGRALAALLCLTLLLVIGAGLVLLLKWQSSDLVHDLAGIEQRITEMIGQLKQFVSSKLGISAQQQKTFIEEQQASGAGQLSAIVAKSINSILSIAVDLVLILVYAFLFLYFRHHFKQFLLKLVPANAQPETRRVIYESSRVARQYLTGLAAMIVMLWVMYGIGFSIVGVKQAIFLAVLCGLLETIPFVGNLTGTLITVLVTMAQGGDGQMMLGILLVYGIVQFTQTYLLEPLVVGTEVSINPLFTILIIVVGEAVWGIPGMILALPVLGIVKIICDHVEPLKPYGFLIGKVGKEDSPGLKDKLKRVFRKR
ncbi:AI-2E family transporter [Spirosoma sp. SC4-14]|uniref:AI-2E family transporter n=1 Tax=Spirosoma sp. SC4-14 TaxID=3128900 RepID=UPI0030CB9C01